MKPNTIKSIITGLVIAGAVGYLAFTSFAGNDGEASANMVYYKTVEEVLQNRTEFEKKPVRVNGVLVVDSIKQIPGTDQFKFALQKNETILTVDYAGILPDNVSPGKELIVQGTLIPGQDTLKATEILTKCPSKYEKEAESRNK